MAESLADQVRESLRLAKERAWEEGYRACYEGRQRHNPHRKTEPNDTKVELRDLLQ